MKLIKYVSSLLWITFDCFFLCLDLEKGEGEEVGSKKTGRKSWNKYRQSKRFLQRAISLASAIWFLCTEPISKHVHRGTELVRGLSSLLKGSCFSLTDTSDEAKTGPSMTDTYPSHIYPYLLEMLWEYKGVIFEKHF